jgi:quinol monooxygenase YgiN
MKIRFTMIAILAMFTFTSCKKESDKEITTETTVTDTTATIADEAPAFKPFKVMAVTHVVKDFDKWKKGFDEDEMNRSANGLTLRALARGIDNPNNVFVFLNVSDLQKAKDFAASPKLKDIMQKLGVMGKPEIIYVDVVRFEESPTEIKDRIRISHKVKNFDTWLKTYDAEGTETRSSNGLIERAITRNIDDPNLIHLTFAVSDMAKVKARLKDPTLKKIMTEAGVISEPVFEFYTSVE